MGYIKISEVGTQVLIALEVAHMILVQSQALPWRDLVGKVPSGKLAGETLEPKWLVFQEAAGTRV